MIEAAAPVPAAAADRPGDPGRWAGARQRRLTYVVKMLRDVVAVVVMLLMSGDIARMLLAGRWPPPDARRGVFPVHLRSDGTGYTRVTIAGAVPYFRRG